MHLIDRDPTGRERQRSVHTRRQLLITGALGLAGLSLPGLFNRRVSAQSGIAEKELTGRSAGAPTVLEPGDAADVGMSAERLGKVTDRLQAETQSGGLTSVSLLVARHGKVILHRGFGKLNPHPGAPGTEPNTVYLLASITKPVSVCGLMLLVERGKVVLSDPVQRYLPEFQGDHKEKVRVWHLLSHTSGMPDMLPENVELRRGHAPLSKFVDEALRTPLLYEPGTEFAYQSMGTLLAAEITERVSGMRFRDFLRQEIFEGLEMKQSVLGLNELKIEETAIFQEKNRGSEDSRRWGPNSPYWRDMGHPWGGMHSTTGDLAILLQTFLNGGVYDRFRLFSPVTTAAMIRDHNHSSGEPWGLGWGLRDSHFGDYFGDLGSSATFGHVGSTGTVAWADPARQLICVLLSTRAAFYRRGFLLKSVSNMVQAAIEV